MLKRGFFTTCSPILFLSEVCSAVVLINDLEGGAGSGAAEAIVQAGAKR